MRALEIALTALALRSLAPKPPRRERRLVPAVDDPGAALLDREALDGQRAALIASLWPEARPCVVATVYLQLPAPALFGAALRVSWRPPSPAEAEHALPQSEGSVRSLHAWAA